MLEKLEDARYQARCTRCYRSSPILAGTRANAEAFLLELEWERSESSMWRCPVCFGRARTQPPPSQPKKKPGRKTILLVEDDFDARAIYRATLQHVGYRVIEAPTVRDARNAVRAFLPDLVVLDCRLPDGDGLQLLTTWRDTNMGPVPVIVVSAHRERQDLDAALVAGADLFVPKPCPGNVLAAHIARVIEAGAPTRRLRASV
jgi:CheY-like chemotaxis protein